MEEKAKELYLTKLAKEYGEEMNYEEAYKVLEKIVNKVRILYPEMTLEKLDKKFCDTARRYNTISIEESQ